MNDRSVSSAGSASETLGAAIGIGRSFRAAGTGTGSTSWPNVPSLIALPRHDGALRTAQMPAFGRRPQMRRCQVRATHAARLHNGKPRLKLRHASRERLQRDRQHGSPPRLPARRRCRTGRYGRTAHIGHPLPQPSPNCGSGLVMMPPTFFGLATWLSSGSR